MESPSRAFECVSFAPRVPGPVNPVSSGTPGRNAGRTDGTANVSPGTSRNGMVPAMPNRRGRMFSPARLICMGWSIGLCALAVYAAARGELSVAKIAALSVAWFALGTTGVLYPQLEMYGPIISLGPSGRMRVALTFDDGPDPVTTRRILESLGATRHRATFFVLGAKARRHPDVVREIHAGGHTLGVHG